VTTETPAVGLATRPAAGTNRRSFAWMDDALCAQIGPSFWFSEDGSVANGQRVCSECPVRAECANHVIALEAETPGGRRYGVWAGRSGNDRRKAEPPIVGNPARDARIVRLAGQGWDAVRIADEVGCEERTVYRALARTREAS
jgi:WhiB family redox-sensing transcriptional regulator